MASPRGERRPGVEDARGRVAYSHNGGRFMITKPIDGRSTTVLNGSTIGFQMKDAAQAEAWHKAGVANGRTSIEDSSKPGASGQQALPGRSLNKGVGAPLTIREATLGPDPPDTATSLSNLGRLLHDHGDLAEARPLYERAQAISEAALGSQYPLTSRITSNFAKLLLDRVFRRRLPHSRNLLSPLIKLRSAPSTIGRRILPA
jgi:Tetratricopeptide repeat